MINNTAPIQHSDSTLPLPAICREGNPVSIGWCYSLYDHHPDVVDVVHLVQAQIAAVQPEFTGSPRSITLENYTKSQNPSTPIHWFRNSVRVATLTTTAKLLA
jgi:hypothetical protein